MPRQVGGHWEYPAIKGWESSKEHFGFKSDSSLTGREEHFRFETHEVCPAPTPAVRMRRRPAQPRPLPAVCVGFAVSLCARAARH